MEYNGKLLARARERQNEQREENRRTQEDRLDRIYALLPAVRATDIELRRQMSQLTRLLLRGGDPTGGIAELERSNLDLQVKRAELLVGAGYPPDYTDDIYSCPLCRDTGVYEGGVCSCLRRLYNEELNAELGTLLRCGAEAFADFRTDFYPDAPGADGVSPRQCMELVLSSCKDYAASFGKKSRNLIFRGGTGLGKTFLSGCIARVVAGAGHTVAYESAPTALGAFETQRFSRDQEEADAAAARVRSFLSCDLMILDDLGTEVVTAFTLSALYQLINTRLINGLKTIISTNCGDAELQRRYGAQIYSRLCGEFEILPFMGRDIRLIRKERDIT